MINWHVCHKDGTLIKSGKGQYPKINRKTATDVYFTDGENNIITRIDVKGKKFIIRRHVFFRNFDPNDVISAVWVCGWENGWLRKPTVYYIFEDGFSIRKMNIWAIRKPIPREDEK